MCFVDNLKIVDIRIVCSRLQIQISSTVAHYNFTCRLVKKLRREKFNDYESDVVALNDRIVCFDRLLLFSGKSVLLLAPS